MPRTPIIILATILMSPLTILGAENQNIKNIENLSNSSVNVIFQDSLEYVWIGTWDGLNRYDGDKVLSYFPKLGDMTSISNNIIRDIKEESKGLIWITTDWGVNRFDVRTGQFERHFLGYEHSYPARENVYSIAISKNGQIFCSSYGWGLAHYNAEDKSFNAINSAKFKTQNINKIIIDENDLLWIYDDDQEVTLIKWKQEGDKIDFVDIRQPFRFKVSFFDISQKYLIYMTEDRVLEIFDRVAGEKVFGQAINHQITKVMIIGSTVWAAYKDGQSGFFTLSDSTTDKTYRHIDFPEEARYMQNISCFMSGTQNIAWIGTDGNGVSIFYNKTKKFEKLDIEKPGGPVRAIIEDNIGNIFIGTKGGGIHQTDAKGQHKKQYSTEDGLIDNRIYCFIKSSNNEIFIGTEGGGINILENGSVSKLDFNGFDIKAVSGVYALALSDNEATLWAGTAYNGLIRLGITKENGKYRVNDMKKFPIYKSGSDRPTNNAIYKIIQDGNKLWIASRGAGVLYFDIVSEEFQEIECLDPSVKRIIENSDVLSLFKDSKNNLWVGTSLGLNRFTFGDDNVLEDVFVYRNMFPNNTIHGIIEDKSGQIWISTNKGLIKLDVDTEEVVSYNESDGLQGDEFSDGAYYPSSLNNYIYFGGTRGVNRFVPRQIIPDTYMPCIHFENIKINNVPIGYQMMYPKDNTPPIC